MDQFNRLDWESWERYNLRPNANPYLAEGTPQLQIPQVLTDAIQARLAAQPPVGNPTAPHCVGTPRNTLQHADPRVASTSVQHQPRQTTLEGNWADLATETQVGNLTAFDIFESPPLYLSSANPHAVRANLRPQPRHASGSGYQTGLAIPSHATNSTAPPSEETLLPFSERQSRIVLTEGATNTRTGTWTPALNANVASLEVPPTPPLFPVEVTCLPATITQAELANIEQENYRRHSPPREPRMRDDPRYSKFFKAVGGVKRRVRGRYDRFRHVLLQFKLKGKQLERRPTRKSDADGLRGLFRGKVDGVQDCDDTDDDDPQMSADRWRARGNGARGREVEQHRYEEIASGSKDSALVRGYLAHGPVVGGDAAEGGRASVGVAEDVRGADKGSLDAGLVGQKAKGPQETESAVAGPGCTAR